jgi:aerobic carbon-monoxide dehydrogenase medium subunit
MRPPKFEYYRPATIGEAIEILSTIDNAKALAGGHSLIPAMNLRLAQPDALVDLGRLDELRTITANGTLRIGALCTHNEIAMSADVQTYASALSTAAGKIGDPQVRNWGTIGGNIAHSDPAADLPTAVLACGGIVHIQGPDGARAIAADDFFIDLFTVDLMPGELIDGVELPMSATARSGYAKFPHPASHYALVGVGVVLEMDGGQCQSARVAVGGSVPKATRSPGAEATLSGSALDDNAINAAADALLDDVSDSIMGDMFAPEDYRRKVTKVYFKRAVHTALGREMGH